MTAFGFAKRFCPVLFCAELMELADMQDLGSCAARREGSSPSFRIDSFRGVFFIAQKKPWRFGIFKFSAETGKAVDTMNAIGLYEGRLSVYG